MSFTRTTPAALSSSSLGGLTRADGYAQEFCESGRTPVRLPNGMIARPTWIITREDESRLNQVQRAQSNLLDAYWQPKVTNPNLGYGFSKQLQRCVRVWVDNFIFFHYRGMTESELLLGEWNKKAMVYGTEQQIHGLVVAGGGHYEAVGNKPPNVEVGDLAMRAAADKELFEEVKIPRERVRATQLLGCIDDFQNDPRCHGIRFVYLRWVEMEPKPTDELKTVLSVPVSMLSELCSGQAHYTRPDGKQLSFVLNHDRMVQTVMAHPVVSEFLAKVHAQAQTPAAANGVGARVFG